MKMVFSSIMVFLIMNQSLAAGESFFSQRDKQKHILGTGVLASAFTGMARSAGLPKIESFFIGVGAAVALGLLKEGLDGYDAESTRSWGDAKADAIGAVMGAGISAQFEWKF